jgi:hypothetical protein
MDEGQAAALLNGLLTIMRLAVFADARSGVEAVLPDGRTYRVGDAEPTVRVQGDVGEVALWVAGRGRAAHVDVDGEVPEAALRV